MNINMINRIEGNNIVLRKAKFDDYNAMLKNVWGNEDVYRWMLFKPTFTIDEAIDRINRSIIFQKDNYEYFIAIKDTDEAIGLCGIREYNFMHYEESGICIAPKYQGMGYGKEVLSLLLDLAFNKLNAIDFRYGYFKENVKSKKLAQTYKFKYKYTETIIRPWDNEEKIVEQCILTKEEYINE